ncbi:MAG: DUF1254 domain-containing protein [Thermoleophilia bacterium]|nr:DUF1254 domain-containing protein [Thermoleophilia bacterium]
MIAIPVGSAQAGKPSPLTDPARIQELASDAYIWGLAPEFVFRFEKYNNLVTAPRNTFGGGSSAAAWNNNNTNAGDASVVYLNSMMDLSGKKGRGGTKELVMRVPPSKNNYYVVNLLDAFVNSVGSMGTRTTPSARAQTYLLAGPTSRYAHRRSVKIDGFRYRVMTSDTNLNWMLIRIRANTLVPASDPSSAASISKTVVQRFALNTLDQFEARNHRPKYFKPGTYTPTSEQRNRAQKWHNAPTRMVVFLKQLGNSLKLNPLPKKNTGLNGIRLKKLPDWVVPQYGARKRYRNPAFGQAGALRLFKPLGMTASGFSLPSNWRKPQIQALQAGYEAGQETANTELNTGTAAPGTNYWSYLNTIIGTYPNRLQGYLYRAVVVLAGGSANVPLDAIYGQANNLDGTSATQLDGNNTYELTFTPPVTDPPTLPVIGSLPPTVNDSEGDPRGFWSIHVYQTDASQSAAPFITQTSVLNTAYSNANLAVTDVDASNDSLTVTSSRWGPLAASSPVLFGSTAAQYGLSPGEPYYVASTPTKGFDKSTKRTTYSFEVSSEWLQELSSDNVPIQGINGEPGPAVDLIDPGGAVNLQWGPIQPVSQLGSQQLTSGSLAKNPDGSVTIWIAPALPPGAPATNWIPTPSDAYNASLYPGVDVPTEIRPMIRMYYPTPGSDTQASILPPPDRSMGATYVFPAIETAD